jgi:carbon monoxide dehydrogenase subunit G
LVFSNTIEIAATPGDVWQRLADHVTWSEWFPSLDKVEVTGAPAGIGGKRRVTVSRLPLDEEFTAWTEEEQFAFAIVKSPLLFVAALAEDIRLEATDSGCRITYRQGIEAKKGCSWLAKAAFRSLDASTAEALNNLKSLVET